MVNHLVNWLSPLKERSTVVTGERGCFIADTLTADLTFYANGAVTTEWEAHARLPRRLRGRHDPLRHRQAGAAAGRARAFPRRRGRATDATSCTLRQGLRTVEVAAAVLESASDRRDGPRGPDDDQSLTDVTVVVPVYNTMPYLTSCLDSLVEQTIGLDRLEVVAVDDGSTDGSGGSWTGSPQRTRASSRWSTRPTPAGRPGRATAAWTWPPAATSSSSAPTTTSAAEALERLVARRRPVRLRRGAAAGWSGSTAATSTRRIFAATDATSTSSLAAALVAVQHQAVPARPDRAARPALSPRTCRSAATSRSPSRRAPGPADIGAGRLHVLLRRAPARRPQHHLLAADSIDAAAAATSDHASFVAGLIEPGPRPRRHARPALQPGRSPSCSATTS